MKKNFVIGLMAVILTNCGKKDEESQAEHAAELNHCSEAFMSSVQEIQHDLGHARELRKKATDFCYGGYSQNDNESLNAKEARDAADQKIEEISGKIKIFDEKFKNETTCKTKEGKQIHHPKLVKELNSEVEKSKS